jgi:hypothetical protein
MNLVSSSDEYWPLKQNTYLSAVIDKNEESCEKDKCLFERISIT